VKIGVYRNFETISFYYNWLYRKRCNGRESSFCTSKKVCKAGSDKHVGHEIAKKTRPSSVLPSDSCDCDVRRKHRSYTDLSNRPSDSPMLLATALSPSASQRRQLTIPRLLFKEDSESGLPQTAIDAVAVSLLINIHQFCGRGYV